MMIKNVIIAIDIGLNVHSGLVHNTNCVSDSSSAISDLSSLLCVVIILGTGLTTMCPSPSMDDIATNH